MSWEQAVARRLLADPGTSALVGKRIDWDEREQGSRLPAVVLQLVSDARPQTMDGFDSIRPSRVRVNCLSDDKAQAIVLREATVAALVEAGLFDGIWFDRGQIDAVRALGERTDTGFVHREAVDIISGTKVRRPNMPLSAATTGHGAQLFIDIDGLGYARIAEIDDIPELPTSSERELYETTNFDTVEYKEWKKHPLKDGVPITITGNYTIGSVSDGLLQDADDATDALPFRIVLKQGAESYVVEGTALFYNFKRTNPEGFEAYLRDHAETGRRGGDRADPGGAVR